MSTTITYKGETLATVSNNTKILKTSGKYMEDDVTLIDVSQVSPSLQAKTNINPSTSSQTIEADSGYDGLSSVQINAMPALTLPTSAAGSATSGYISKATISRSTSDQYINIGTGYNSAGAYYKINAVANGTEGTPTATKGTVSNNSISITPSVTNTGGYISGSTKTGTAVTVRASELVSGNKAITENGTNIDVTNYATVSVNVASNAIISDTLDSHGGTIRTITTGQTLNLQSKSVIPTSSQQTITPDTGYNGLSEVIVEASSGGGYVTQDANGYVVLSATNGVPTLISKTITESGTYNPVSDGATGYSSVTVTAGGVNIGTATATDPNWSLTFTGLSGEPQAFFVDGAVEAASAYLTITPITSIRYDGTNTVSYYVSTSGSVNTVPSGTLTWAYNNGNLYFSLPQTSSGRRFGGDYTLTYIY